MDSPRRIGRNEFRRLEAAAAAALGGDGGLDTASRGSTTIVAPESQFRTCPSDHGIQLAVGPQPLWLRNHNSGLAHRIMVKRLATSPHDPLGITDSACKNQLVVVSVQYGPFNPFISIRSTTIGKSRVAIDPIAMHTSWRSNSDIASVTRVSVTFRVVRTNQYNQDLGLIHSTNGNHLENPKEGSSIDHQVTIYLHAQNITMFPTNETWYFASQILVSNSGGLILTLTAQSTRNMFRIHRACNNCGQVGHFARVCPTLGQQTLTRSSSRRPYRPFQSQLSGFQPSEASNARELSLSKQSGLQPTQVDATTVERDDDLTEEGCSVLRVSSLFLLSGQQIEDVRASGDTALSSPCWDLLALMRRVVNYHSSWVGQWQVELFDASGIRVWCKVERMILIRLYTHRGYHCNI
ncbi:hypothetical protein F511_17750 [Dorcoceras hygrometricum]|uniref:CCHC-type domain-containing protein n=1 Tax=Dorcoceras hygrometricum TaxID=472368 RepID=A0A2Z7AYG7_9LAMI|nr:hypothetical protein F511_17750 [Dorcoceras hygrometricum]